MWQATEVSDSVGDSAMLLVSWEGTQCTKGFCPDEWLWCPAEHRLRAPWWRSPAGLCFPEDAGQDVHGCSSQAGPPPLILEEVWNRWGWGCVFLTCDRFAQYHKLAVISCFPSIKRKMLQNCLEYKWIHTPYVAIYIYIHLGHPADLVMEQVLVISSFSSAHKHLSANNWVSPRLHLNCSL